EQAAKAARRTLGNATYLKEDLRGVWNWTFCERLIQDLRYAARTLRRNRAFTAAAILSLALGIGANTAIFSLIDALMLRSLPVHRPQDLVQLNFAGDATSPAFPTFSYPMARAFDEQRSLFDGVCGYTGSTFAAGAPGAISRVPGAFVTGSCYETLGLNPAAGRLIARDDDKPGAPA